MTRASGITLQILVVAIFVSALVFFGMAVSRAEAMLDMHSYESMPVPEPRGVGEGSTWHFGAEVPHACVAEDPLDCGDLDDSL